MPGQHPPMFLLITMVLIAMIRASQFHLPFMAHNQQGLKILSTDFNHDGSPSRELAIQYVRQVPYYGGDYWQLLLNDGTGDLEKHTVSDVTNSNSRVMKILMPTTESCHSLSKQNRRTIQILDINDDGHMDLASYRTSSNNPLAIPQRR